MRRRTEPRTLRRVVLALATLTALGVMPLARAATTPDVGIGAAPHLMLPADLLPDTSGETGSSGPAANAATTASQPPLRYWQGSIQKYPSIYVVYWGWPSSLTSDESNYKTKLQGFLNGIGGSDLLNVDTQYSESARGVITNPTAQLAGVWSDSAAVPATPTDQDVADEAARAVRHFGANADSAYIVATPHGHNSAGFGTHYCGYHNWVRGPSTPQSAYIYLPYVTDSANCGEFLAHQAGLTIVAGHEIAETQTDPFFTGWYDRHTQENGDKCEWGRGGRNPRTISFSTGTYWVQPLWSNRAAGCLFGVNPSFPSAPVTVTDSSSSLLHSAIASCTFDPDGRKVSGRTTTDEASGAISESIECDMSGGGTVANFFENSALQSDTVVAGTAKYGATGSNEICVLGSAGYPDTQLTMGKKCKTF